MISYKPLVYFALAGAFIFPALLLKESVLGEFESKVLEDVSPVSDQPRKTKLLVFGDVMFDRDIRSYVDANGTAKLFEFVQKDISEADATLVNLEGPITENASVVSRENLQFTFAPHTASDLSNIGIRIVSLANNHTHNFGREGLRQTREYLGNADIAFFGDPYNEITNVATRYTLGATTISLVGYHQFENSDITNILNVIKTEKETGNFVIFFPHWGNEYEKNASANQITKAEEVINAGADIVVGAHPHVIQNAEVYNNKPVFYSLGNFMFDQWFSEDVKYGLGLSLTFSGNTLQSVELKPFYRARYQPKWLEGEDRVGWCKLYIQGTLYTYNKDNPCLLML